MEDIIYTAIGLFAVYTWVHFYVFSFTKTWADRNKWERFVTIVAALLFANLLTTFW